MASENAIRRLVPLVKDKLSSANQVRLDKLVAALGQDGSAVLASVLAALYPQHKRGEALTAFRQFRRAVALAAEEAGVEFGIETDGQTRAKPENRVVRFEAEDRVVQEVTRMVEAEVADVVREPQDVLVPLKCFVSYAHNDKRLKDDLLGRLKPFLGALWTDVEIPPGQPWRDTIQDAMEKCDFGLMLLSESFIGRPFIQEVEQPFLLANKRVVPIALKPLLFDAKMKTLAHLQIFFDRQGKAFSERTTHQTKDAFVRELCLRIGKAEKGAPKPKLEDHARRAVEDFDEAKFVHTEGVTTSMSTDLGAAPEIDSRQRKDAIEFLMEWLRDTDAQPYCALLGEYGMGKTTTCKALARDLLKLRDAGKPAPLPIYLDLRLVGESAKRDLVLDEILDLIIKRGWKGGPGATNVTAQEIVALVEKDGALVIWDGLDEVLVHLDTNPGQQFTRQLFRILPPRRKGEPRRGRLLISCRTHYFRTLRDQQNHFRAEDRDSIHAEDYRAPFVLLPFTEDQIRTYLHATLPNEDTDRVMEVVGSVHNLTEMAERPYTLSLITQQFAQIEQWKAQGRRVTGLMLYRHMVLSWLERDTGKHQITTDHKQALMEHFAARLWEKGARSWSIWDMEEWLTDWLGDQPKIAAQYRDKAASVLKEDLRTATFLVREGEEQFRFAHTSLQEYFLAGYLRRALVEDRPEDWELKRVSPETLDFLGQWLEEERIHRDTALATLGKLRDIYRPQASELAFAYFLTAHSKGYPAPSPAAFQLPGADLTDWEIEGSAGAPLMLAGMNLRGARLWRSRWRHCNLENAIFDGADAYQAEWLGCHLTTSSWRQSKLEGTLFRKCGMRNASFEGADCMAAQLLGCALEGAAGLPAGRPGALFAPVPDEAVNGRTIVNTGHSGPVRACAWSPDGARILSASDDTTLRIWDAYSGALLSALQDHTGSVLACAWSPDGARILSASNDKTLRIWDAHSGALLSTLKGHSSSVSACAWSPDGARILSASDDTTLRIWDAYSGALLSALQDHTGSVLACAWSPDGARILSASNDKTLRIWDAHSRALLTTLQGHSGNVWACAWSPDGARILSASNDTTLRIWDAHSGALLSTFQGHSGSALACAWSPDGARILSASNDTTLRIWDAHSGALLSTFQGHSGSALACAWSPDGARILSASNDTTLRIWDAHSGALLSTLKDHTGSVLACAWSPDGARILSASNDKTLRIWDAHSRALLTTLQGHSGNVWACAWSPDGARILSASHDTTLGLWDAHSGALLSTLKGHSRSVSACAWSPDGARILSASHDTTLGLWDAHSGALLSTLKGHSRSVSACAWSPDGARILSASHDKTLGLWDAHSGALLSTLKGHSRSVSACAWSLDGARILSASDDKTLRIWDAHSGALLATLQGHSDWVRACAWSPDGVRILSASDDNTLRIWDAHSGELLSTLQGHSGWVWACAWSPDGARILSSSYDGTMRLWDASTGAELVPTFYHFGTPEGPSWCAVDHPNNRILSCDDRAWRRLGWIVPEAGTGFPQWLPAETYGPLPVVETHK